VHARQKPVGLESSPQHDLMHKIACIIAACFLTPAIYAQTCNCESNFNWVKKTFEENDAGFRYALEQKGKEAYAAHNLLYSGKIKKVSSFDECTDLLNSWLKFFRSGHVGIRLKQPPAQAKSPSKNQFKGWDTLKVDTVEFRKYLAALKDPGFEGIWETSPYKIGIRKVKNKYIGFIIESGAETWKPYQVKLRITQDSGKISSVFYRRDHSAAVSDKVILTGKNYLQLGNYSLKRIFPEMREDKTIEEYYRMLEAGKPYIRPLNEHTLYFRIPSFSLDEKPFIDSVIAASRKKILNTENLIIDIRYGTGGSDASFREIIPFIYTNPIRTVGVEYLSTPLNNQRMLEFLKLPDSEFDKEDKKWARKAYEKLNKRIGQFVNPDTVVAEVLTRDTVHRFPRRVGIIINEGNGSTDEQFLLAAKQSKKVKLFGTTSRGVLDISNMYFVNSPCKEFELGYCLTRSMRIPDFTIDDKGIQPDYYLDKEIPLYEWVDHVNKILNE
jgi:hypothetical protein